MNEEHKNALERNLHDICQNLDAEDILPYLRSKGVIQEGQAQEIMKIIRKSTQNMRLIDLIKGAGPLAFQEFINALQNYNKEHLAEKILAHLPSSSTQKCLAELITIAQQSLKEMYLIRFKKVYPFSLPFTFDIENTWVSLALREDSEKKSQATKDHAELLKTAFEKVKMLIIEGDPATGKTSLMRRLAYEWARQKEEQRETSFMLLKNWVREKLTGQEERKGISLLCYDLVLYAEFREVREEKFQSIAHMVLYYSKKYLAKEVYGDVKKLLNNEKFCKESRILVLLDGYDESSLGKQCLELSSYISKKMINKALLFDTVVTTRKGYLSKYRDVKKGRLAFAEVLGFTTMTQKEKYISNHFFSEEIDNIEKISAVLRLLAKNENITKLAKTPLFLTFICLVYEKIIDGTLLELYCNIIRWLIDRHQQDNPDRDVPALFDYQGDFAQASEPLDMREKQNVIRNKYLQFPQLLSLGKMAMNNLKKDIFQETDFTEFNIKSIIHQVGLIRKDELYDQSWNLTTTYSFPHRTVQEFFAAFYCFCSDETTNEWLSPDSKLDISEYNSYTRSGMNEFSRFLFRIALSDKMPVQAEKRKYYFDRITEIKPNMIAFDAFNSTSGFNNNLQNWFFSQCTNVQNITLNGEWNRARYARNIANHTAEHNESAVTSQMSNPALLSFSDLVKLRSLTFDKCTFSTNSQLSVTSCPNLENLKFKYCELKSNSITNISTLPEIKTLLFTNCTFETNSQLSFSDLIKLRSLSFGGDSLWDGCTFSANSQLSFTSCPFLKKLIFMSCKMESSTSVGIATLPAIHTVQFDQCDIDLATWQSITDQIRNSTVKYLHLSADSFVERNPGFIHHLHNCGRIQQIHVCDVFIATNYYFLIRNEEEVSANLALTAQQLPALTSITLSDECGRRLHESRRLNERNRERIEKAGQQRYPRFSIKYVEYSDPELE